MFLEYPKFLSIDGKPDGHSVIVQNKEEEDEKRKEGFRVIGERQKESEEPKKRKAK